MGGCPTASHRAMGPLLSTLILIVFGFGEFSLRIALAAILIVAGALLASMNILRRRNV